MLAFDSISGMRVGGDIHNILLLLLLEVNVENTLFCSQGIEHMYTLSYQWLASVGILVTLIVGVVVSWASGE